MLLEITYLFVVSSRQRDNRGNEIEEYGVQQRCLQHLVCQQPFDDFLKIVQCPHKVEVGIVFLEGEQEGVKIDTDPHHAELKERQSQHRAVEDHILALFAFNSGNTPGGFPGLYAIYFARETVKEIGNPPADPRKEVARSKYPFPAITEKLSSAPRHTAANEGFCGNRECR